MPFFFREKKQRERVIDNVSVVFSDCCVLLWHVVVVTVIFVVVVLAQSALTGWSPAAKKCISISLTHRQKTRSPSTS